MNKTDILNPVLSIQIARGELVEVRELCWKDYMRAVKELTGTLMKLVGGEAKEVSFSALKLEKDAITQAITEQEQLLTWVLCKSTGRDQAWVDSLTGREVLPLLNAIVDLNLSQEVLDAGKHLAGRMGAAFVSLTNSAARPTSSSSPAIASKK